MERLVHCRGAENAEGALKRVERESSARDFAAVVLAAGRSRRMGAFKPLLPFGSCTVVETVINNLRAASIDEIVVVVGLRADEMREALRGLNVRFALNEEAESEMGASIACGIERISAKARAVVIALVDQPAIPAEVIDQLICEQQRTGAPLLIPEWEGRGGHPVLVDLKFRDELLHLDAQRGLRALFEKYGDEVLRVRVDSPFVRRDMDRWEDYCALHREVFGVPPPIEIS